MSVSIGRRGWVGVNLETSAGTGGDTPKKYLPYTSQSLHNVVEVLDDEAAKGIRERAWGSVVARERGEGDITILLDAKNAPYLLFPALGTGTVTGVQQESNVYLHKFTRKASNPPRTLCLNVYDTAEKTTGGENIRKYHYGTVNTAEISFSDGWVELTAGILSKKPVAGAGTLDITEENVLAFKDANIYFGDTLSSAAKSTPKKLTAFTLTINNNAEAQYVSGSTSPAQISMGQLEIGGDYTLFFEDTTEQAAHENQTHRAMIVSFIGEEIGNSSREEIRIKIPSFHLTDRGIDTSPEGFVTENPTFVVDYDPDFGSIEIEVRNTEDHYEGETYITSLSSSSCSSSESSSSSVSPSSSSSSSWSQP